MQPDPNQVPSAGEHSLARADPVPGSVGGGSGDGSGGLSPPETPDGADHVVVVVDGADQVPDCVPPLPATIDEVLDHLTEIIGYAITLSDRAGFFAILYHHVTAAVKAGLATGMFRDPQTMAKLDVVFANRYLDAFQTYSRSPKSISESWHVALKCTKVPSLSVVQHLLLGMNAHINLDLPVAAAEVGGPELSDDFQEDFFTITNLLIDLTERITTSLLDVSPRLAYLYRLGWGGRGGRGAAHALLRVTRGEAWEAAKQLAQLPAPARATAIAALDQDVARIAREIANPRGLSRWVFRVIAETENKSVPVVARTLRKQLDPRGAAQLVPMSTDRRVGHGYYGPTTWTEAILWIVWPFYLRRRTRFYALLVLAVLIGAGYWFWTSLDPSRRSRVIDTFLILAHGGSSAYEGVQILDQKVVADLREVRTVPPGKMSEPVSVAKWKTTMTGIKVKETASLFANRGGTTSPIPPEFRCNYPYRVTPASSTVAGVNYQRWDVHADISDVRVNDPFIMVFETDTWNSYQGSHQDATAACLHPVPQITFEILAPRPLSNLKYYRVFQDPKSERVELRNPTAQLSDDGLKLVWVITNPVLNHGYRVEWDW